MTTFYDSLEFHSSKNLQIPFKFFERSHLCTRERERVVSPTDRNRNKSSLGIFTKTHVMPTQQGLERFDDFLLQDQSAKLLPKERVCNCLKKRIDKNRDREVRYNEVRKKAHWANVQRCGSVWTCPVCAKQITEKRRQELKSGIEKWKTIHFGGVLLLTLTFSHSVKESLSSLLQRQIKALKIFNETTKVQDLLRRIGVQYKIKALEVTYGQNGWHPHNHILLLTKNQVHNFKDYISDLSVLWIKACIKAGLNAPSMTYGLDIRDGSYAEKYVSKWGLDAELTKGHIKKGRNSGFSPFDLLQLSLGDIGVNGRTFSSLFQEFGIATKGKRQLEWGRGLKKLLFVHEKTDEELAQETEKDSIILLPVDGYIFSLLCIYQKRWDFLRYLEMDYENGCFGCGQTEQLLIHILEIHTENFRRGRAAENLRCAQTDNKFGVFLCTN